MATRNSNLLVSGAAQPSAGLQWANAVAWYGGDIQIDKTGVAGGASVEVYFSTNIPKLNPGQGYGDVIPDADLILLTNFADGASMTGQLNPCLLVAKVLTPSGTTRTKVIVN